MELFAEPFVDIVQTGLTICHRWQLKICKLYKRDALIYSRRCIAFIPSVYLISFQSVCFEILRTYLKQSYKTGCQMHSKNIVIKTANSNASIPHAELNLYDDIINHSDKRDVRRDLWILQVGYANSFVLHSNFDTWKKLRNLKCCLWSLRWQNDVKTSKLLPPKFFLSSFLDLCSFTAHIWLIFFSIRNLLYSFAYLNKIDGRRVWKLDRNRFLKKINYENNLARFTPFNCFRKLWFPFKKQFC